MKNTFKPRQLTLLGLLTALLIIMSVTPLGYLRIGPLSATLNMIPVGVAAIALGPTGGAITGVVFGLTSFVNALTGGSALGTWMVSVSPVLAFLECFVPRLLMGVLVGFLHQWMSKVLKNGIAGFVTGFCAAFINTALFMTGLVLLFGNTDYLQSLIGGRNVILFMCTFVGVNAILEMIVSTVIVGILGKTLEKAHLLGR